jgi:RNA polymerase sigma-70 factor (ECF subfamily)
MPEPLLGGDPMLGPADTVEQRESVTLAVLTLMERLSPVERAAYVLREAFAYTHAEIAEILGVTEAGSQQHAHRARRRIAAAGNGVSIDIDNASARQIVEAFVDAASSGRTERLVALLTDDATGISDGVGGLSEKLIRYTTPARIARAVCAGLKPSPAKRKLVGGSPSIYAGVVNGCPAMLVTLDGRVLGVTILEIRDREIAGVRGIAAPTRLRRLNEEWQRRKHDVALMESW